MTPSQQSRMLKCLGSLVVAMTIGAVLLSISEPSLPPANRQARAASTLALADGLIRQIRTDPNVAEGRWHQIVLHAREAAASGRSMKLAATIHSSPYHFLVTRTGGLLAGPSWHSQSPAGVPTDAVHIWVEPAGEGQVLPSVVERVLLGLVDALMTRCAIDREAIHSAAGSEIPLVGGQAEPLRPG